MEKNSHQKYIIKWVVNWNDYSTCWCGLEAREMEDSPLFDWSWLNVQNVESSSHESSRRLIFILWRWCEANIILHTLESIRFWDCILFSHKSVFCIPYSSFFLAVYFSSEIERAEFQYKCQITSLCARKPNIVFIDLSWILNSPVTIVTNFKKSIVLGRVSTVAFFCSDDNVHVVNPWLSGWKSECLQVCCWGRTLGNVVLAPERWGEVPCRGPARRSDVIRGMEIFSLWSQ